MEQTLDYQPMESTVGKKLTKRETRKYDRQIRFTAQQDAWFRQKSKETGLMISEIVRGIIEKARTEDLAQKRKEARER